jgi:hypothetical protein
MNIIFQINGGIGKSIIATGFCKAIKKKYPNDKLIVVTGYPDVFLNSKDVDMAFAFGQESYFFTKYVENQDILVFANEPYLVTEHIQQKEHLIETWCKMYDIPYNGETPEIYLNSREISFYEQKFVSDKPILLLQTNGGAEQQPLKYSWARDIPSCVVQNVINEFKNDYNIVHIRRDDQPAYENTIQVTDSFRALVVLISRSTKRLFMDSFAQHTAAALGLKSTVLWVVNSPKVFGYEIHDNIQCNPFSAKPELRNSFLSKFNIIGDLIEFPYNKEEEIFNVEDVINSIKRQ